MNRDVNDEMTTQMTQKRLVSGAMGFLVALGCGVSAFHGYAEDEAMEKLLKTLKERGSISDAEYGDILKASKKSAVSLQGGAADVSLGGRTVTQELLAQRKAIEEIKAMKGVDLKSSLKDKWYEKLSIGGYVQTRFTHVMSPDGSFDMQNGKYLNVPADRSVRAQDSIYFRRARLKLSGDVSERLYVYAQVEFAGTLSGYTRSAGSQSTIDTTATQNLLQMRDFYGDIALDRDKEHRIRVGVSKVPFGFVNMQSSENRLAMERADALNSAVEGERDLGAYYMWASKEARARFKELVKSGLRGSGDYGVFAIGVYNGQGLNNFDQNAEPHAVARLAYPFRMDNGQFIELGLQGYTGNFVPTRGAYYSKTASSSKTPDMSVHGVDDRRAAATFVLYPQPFGIEAEWTAGQGPQLNDVTQRITSQSLQGGYVMVNYRQDTGAGILQPFIRWNYFDGARKFATNAPEDKINEWDFGIQFEPWKELFLKLQYTHTLNRSNTNWAGSATNPAYPTVSGDRIGFQVQFNY
jgi:hypothetical protein